MLHHGEKRRWSASARVVGIPTTMTLAEGLREVRGYSADELESIASTSPGLIECGTMLVSRRS